LQALSPTLILTCYIITSQRLKRFNYSMRWNSDKPNWVLTNYLYTNQTFKLVGFVKKHAFTSLIFSNTNICLLRITSTSMCRSSISKPCDDGQRRLSPIATQLKDQHLLSVNHFSIVTFTQR
jgi:hypothetical protein